MISSLAWIPKGAANANPVYADISEHDIEALRVAAEAEQDKESDGDELSGSDTDSEEDGSDQEMDEAAALAKAKAFASVVKKSSKATATGSALDNTIEDAMAELDMDNYDNEDSGDEDAMQRILGAGNPGMAYYRDPKRDPYFTHHSGDGEGSSDGDDSEDDSEKEDLNLREGDLLIMAARNEEDISNLEVWVYEEPDERGEGNLYVHHTILLPAFPLALAWGDCDPTGGRQRGNFAAVASFEPGIEIWDLDVLDAVEPVATLGGADYEAARNLVGDAGGSSKKKGGKKKKKASAVRQVPVRPGSHEDAVLGLSWNLEFRNVLASASADTTVKVWDVATQTASHTLTHHTDKVQSVAWNPAEAPVLLSGGFDKRACLSDVRAPGNAAVGWSLPADVEALAWDPFSPTVFAVSVENGEVIFFDARSGADSDPVARLAAHEKAATALAFCPGVKGLLLTGSTDKRIKVWGIEEGGAKPTLLVQEDLKVGAVFSASFCRDAPLVVAAGGAKGSVAIWDTANCDAVAAFAKKQQQ